MASVLVLDGEQRAALAVVRSLGRAGHAVYVGSDCRFPLAGVSRYTRGTVLLPDPLKQPEDHAAAVRDCVTRWNINVLLPITEASILSVLPERHRISAVLPFPTLTNFKRICDKTIVADAARALGISVPQQIHLSSPGTRGAAELDALRFPLVLKPGRSITSVNGVRVKRGVSHLADRRALERALDALTPGEYPLLIQERIIGPGLGVFVLFDKGEVLATFSHRRLREKPPSGGVSVYRESVELSAQLRDLSELLLRRFDWQGAAMVEYKIDADSGTPYIMEVNGRFWGSLQLAIDAGVDFPALLVAAASGVTPRAVTSYRRGIRSRWFWGDVDHLIMRLTRSADELALEPGAPTRARAVLDFLAAFGKGSHAEIFRLSDPVPALRETVNWLRRR